MVHPRARVRAAAVGGDRASWASQQVMLDLNCRCPHCIMQEPSRSGYCVLAQYRHRQTLVPHTGDAVRALMPYGTRCSLRMKPVRREQSESAVATCLGSGASPCIELLHVPRRPHARRATWRPNGIRTGVRATNGAVSWAAGRHQHVRTGPPTRQAGPRNIHGHMRLCIDESGATKHRGSSRPPASGLATMCPSSIHSGSGTVPPGRRTVPWTTAQGSGSGSGLIRRLVRGAERYG